MYEINIKTIQGLEEILAQEVKNIGGINIKIGNRVVSFQGTDEHLYSANMFLRTALRVYKPIKVFKATSEDELYRKVKQFDWSSIFDVTDTFAVDSIVGSDYFNHSHYAALKVKDAIVDQFRDKFGERPSIDIESPTIGIHILIKGDICTLSLDSSGESLHKRGYRKDTVEAPINEVLAAGMLLLAGWDGSTNLVDPMCGSATIPIEAALIAKNIAPGTLKGSFAFQNWKDYKPQIWEKIVAKAKNQTKPFHYKIYASDISEDAIECAKVNAIIADTTDAIEFKVCEFTDFDPPKSGMMVMNPPYDERLKIESISELYKSIGDTLKQKYNNYMAYMITSNTEAVKSIGLRTSKRHIIYNGQLECRLLKYELYSGSRKKGAN